LSNAFDRPIICYVTDRKGLGVDPAQKLAQRMGMAIRAGADWVQIREKDLAGRALLAVVRSGVETRNTLGGKVRILVNERIDVALAGGAQGLHLGGESMRAGDVISWCRKGNAPEDFFIGVSCHSLDEALGAEKAGANYVFFGPIFETPSKIAFGRPQGTAQLARVCRNLAIPVIAIGGVNQRNAADCLQAGAAGIAAIHMFQTASAEGELEQAIQQIRGGRG
jgi:thiamine-phosphate pyrophosphorylase